MGMGIFLRAGLDRQISRRNYDGSWSNAWRAKLIIRDKSSVEVAHMKLQVDGVNRPKVFFQPRLTTGRVAGTAKKDISILRRVCRQAH
jgi:hypothetical protein